MEEFFLFKHVLTATLLAGAGLAHAQTTSPNPWATMTRMDLDFAYKSLQESHPGPVNSQDQLIKQRLSRALTTARAEADQAASMADYKRVLGRYFAGFADGHLSVTFDYRPRSSRWTGLIIERQGTSYRIVHLDPQSGLPENVLQSELLACDGRSIDTLLSEDVIPAAFDNQQLVSLKNQMAAHVMFNDEAMPHAEYGTCTVADQGGQRSISLRWADVPRDNFFDARSKAVLQVSRKAAVEQLAPGTYWVSLPEFAPNREQEDQLKAVIARMPLIRDAELVVFDIRGNRGGNSQWGSDVMAGLFGKPYMQQVLAGRGDGYAEWRVSQANLDYIGNEILPRARRQFGADSDNFRRWSNLHERMGRALSRGETLVRQNEAKPVQATQATAQKVAPLTNARIALVTDAGCASSCLDFADEAMTLPGTLHLGETTFADTLYMDVRRVKLPSGLGHFVLPQKVYRGRLRGDSEPYTPSRPFDGPIGDTPRVQVWVLQELKRPAAR